MPYSLCVLFVFICGMGLVSCKKQKTGFEYVAVEKMVKEPLDSNLPENLTPFVEIEMNLMWLKSVPAGCTTADSMNKEIFACIYSLVFGEEELALPGIDSMWAATASLGSANSIENKQKSRNKMQEDSLLNRRIMPIIDRYVSEYKEDCGSFAKDIESGLISVNAASYELVVSAMRADSSSKALVWKISKYSYTGGAHGMEEVKYVNFDPITGKTISLNSVLIDGAAPKITEMIRYRLNQRTDISIFDINEVQMPSIFYLTGDSLHFQYPVYEIAPYSDGAIKVDFSYSEIEQYLKK